MLKLFRSGDGTNPRCPPQECVSRSEPLSLDDYANLIEMTIAIPAQYNPSLLKRTCNQKVIALHSLNILLRLRIDPGGVVETYLVQANTSATDQQLKLCCFADEESVIFDPIRQPYEVAHGRACPLKTW